MSPQEAFKVGFMARCVEAGCDPAAALAAVKSAREKVAGIFDAAANAVTGAVGGVAPYAAVGALAGPPILGGMAGYGLAKMTDVDDADVADVKDRELIDAFKTEAARVRRQTALRGLGAGRPKARLYL